MALALPVTCAGLPLLPAPAAADDPPPLVVHWAPILYHHGEGDPRDDYITCFDFDGDWDGTYNEENLGSGGHPLIASVYYAVIETETHWYLTYAFFHPLDSSILAEPGTDALCILHENDMEGVTLTVRKDGSPFGSFRVMATEAHGDVYYFKSPGSDVRIGSAYRDPVTGGGGPDSIAYFPRTPSEVAVFIEADGHGVGSQYRALSPSGSGAILLGGTVYDIQGRSGLIYHHDGGAGEEPSGAAMEWVRYDLRSMEDLWSRRHIEAGEAP